MIFGDLQVRANQDGNRCRVWLGEKFFNEMMAPNGLKNIQFLRGVDKTDEPLGTNHFASIEAREKRFKF